MRCYDCDKVVDVLVPIRRTEGKDRIIVDVYVCKDCLKRLMEERH